MGDACGVRVIVRFRPVNAREQKEMENSDVEIRFNSERDIEIRQKAQAPINFSFDHIFDPSKAQV